MRRGSRKRSDELRRVYREHVDAVYAFFAYSVDVPTAEDLTSATFERALRSWDSYDAERASERTWLLAIARNLLTDHFRRRANQPHPSVDGQPELLDGLVAADDDPLPRILAQDELRGWLAVLGDRERTVLALRYAADLTGSQIAEVLDLTPANVHQILSRALRRLREVAGERGVSDSASRIA